MWRARAKHTVHRRARQRASFYTLWNVAARALVYIRPRGGLESSFWPRTVRAFVVFFTPRVSEGCEVSGACRRKERRKEAHFLLRNNHTLLHYCTHSRTRSHHAFQSTSIFILPPQNNFQNACIIRQAAALVGMTSMPWNPALMLFSLLQLPVLCRKELSCLSDSPYVDDSRPASLCLHSFWLRGTLNRGQGPLLSAALAWPLYFGVWVKLVVKPSG